MFPIEIPPGTTIESLFTQLVVDVHRRFVSEPAKEELVAAVKIVGGETYTYRVRGRDLIVEEGEPEKCALWIVTRLEHVEKFLADWTGPKRWFPKKAPPGELVVPSDPRLMKRLMMVNGRVEMALLDFEGERVAMTIGCGDAAKKGIDVDEPDVVIEAHTKTFNALLDGRLAPEEALADGDVVQRGKKLVAMQLALAVAAFYPAKR
jgi:putative sterol carrier protein